MKKSRFRTAYLCCLLAACCLVMLETFVIPHDTVSVAAAEASAGLSSSATTVNTSSVVSQSGTYTDTSYTDANMTITLSEEYIDSTVVHIVDIQLTDASLLRTALANDTYGRNVKESTSDMAADHNAILAINGDYYGFRDTGYVIRNGVLYRSTAGSGEDLVIYQDGSFGIIRESEISAAQLLANGAEQVLSFGPALINNGLIAVSTTEDVAQTMSSNPRTAIGMISPLHYIMVVSEGRTGESAGLSLYQLAQVMQDAGCTVAYNLDGGGSSTLYFNGQVINTTVGGRGSSEREVSDIVYIGY